MKRILYLIIMLFAFTLVSCSKSDEVKPEQLLFTKGMQREEILDLAKKILIKEKLDFNFTESWGAVGTTPVIVLNFKANKGFFGFVMEPKGLVAYSHYNDTDEEVEVLYNHLSPEVRDNDKYRGK